MSPTGSDVVEFILHIGEALHKYGAAAHHVEAALRGLSLRFCDEGEFFVSPTAIICSIKIENQWISRLKRVQPGGIHLGKLSQVDEIGDQVIQGQMGMPEGIQRLRKIAIDKDSKGSQGILALSFVLASMGFCGVFRGSWYEMLFTGLLALLSWLVLALIRRWETFEQINEFLIAFMASFLSFAIASMFPYISPEKVTLSSLIVMIPGLSLTIGLSEIATKNWLAGTARLVGAFAELMKMTFGVLLGTLLAKSLFAVSELSIHHASQPVVHDLVLLIPSGFAFGVLFRNLERDYLWVVLGSVLSYFTARWGGQIYYPELGAFWGGLALAAYSNSFARIFQRPALTVLLPGLLPMVPGSVGFKTVSALFNHNFDETMASAFNLVIIAVALVAGLTMGNVLVKPRRSV